MASRSAESAVDVVVVTYNSADHIRACVDAALGELRVARVLIFDNDSQDGTLDVLRTAYSDEPRLVVEPQPSNLGFAAAVNQALKRDDLAPVTLLLNPDCVLGAGALDTMVEVLQGDRRIGLVGPIVEHPEGRLVALSCGRQPGIVSVLLHYSHLAAVTGRRTRPRGLMLYRHQVHEPVFDVEWLTGACLLLRTEAVSLVGPLPTDWFMYAEDMEWCWRFRNQGWRVVLAAQATVMHLVGQSAKGHQRTRTMWVSSTRAWYRKRVTPGPVRSRVFDLVFAAGLSLRSLEYRLVALTMRSPDRRALWRDESSTFRAYASAALRPLEGAATSAPTEPQDVHRA